MTTPPPPSRGGRLGLKSISDKFFWIDLCIDQVFEATRTNASAQFNKYPFDGTILADIGGAIEDLVVHMETANFTANMSAKVVLERKFRSAGYVENDADLLALVSTNTYSIGTAFSTRAKFGRTIRPCLYTQVTAGGSGTHYGEISLSFGVRLFR